MTNLVSKSARQSVKPLCVAVAGACFLSVSSVRALDNPQQPSTAPIAQASDSVAAIEDALLSEMARLANELSAMRKHNELLSDKIDILTHRMEELEELNKTQSDQISALTESSEKETETPVEKKPDQLAQAPKSDRQKQQAPNKDAEKQLPSDFEQFLDMGEAMMRRFFGVVKEFREEFEDNRV